MPTVLPWLSPPVNVICLVQENPVLSVADPTPSSFTPTPPLPLPSSSKLEDSDKPVVFRKSTAELSQVLVPHQTI